MEIRFDGQVVLITGASTGIGAALAKGFGRAGASVVINYNNSSSSAKAVADEIEAEGGKVLLVRADVTLAAEVKQMVALTMERFSRIDVLVNNAGGLLKRELVPDLSDDLYYRIIDLNLTSIFRICQQVIPIMKQQRSGNIINVTSLAARIGGAGGSVIYAASKGGVSTLTRGLAKELAAENIRVNAISPGIIKTPFHDRYTSPELLEAIVKTIPLCRAGQPEECVGAALFLASNAMSSYITGQIIEINGGQYMP